MTPAAGKPYKKEPLFPSAPPLAGETASSWRLHLFHQLPPLFLSCPHHATPPKPMFHPPFPIARNTRQPLISSKPPSLNHQRIPINSHQTTAPKWPHFRPLFSAKIRGDDDNWLKNAMGRCKLGSIIYFYFIFCLNMQLQDFDLDNWMFFLLSCIPV